VHFVLHHPKDEHIQLGEQPLEASERYPRPMDESELQTNRFLSCIRSLQEYLLVEAGLVALQKWTSYCTGLRFSLPISLDA
jgi:hypothetical protein